MSASSKQTGSGKGSGGNKTLVWVGAGCLGCIGIPALLVIGGAIGYFVATQAESPDELARFEDERRPREIETRADEDDSYGWPAKGREVATPKPAEDPYAGESAPVLGRFSVSESELESEIERAREREREATVARPVATATPALASKPSAASAPARSAPKPVATTALPKVVATPVVAIAKPVVAAPTPVKKAATATRSFAEELELEERKPATPAKTPAVASAAPTALASGEEDIFGSTPAPATVATPKPVNPKLRVIQTKSGAREVTVDKKIAIQGSDKKTVIGTLVKVENGWVSVRFSDGQVRMIAESDVLDCSEI